jgi:hypothetical protein
MRRRMGVMGEDGADEEAAEKCFHVPATSPEALSAIRRRCRDMEALFSDFHVGDVRVGVVVGCRGHRLGRLVTSWTFGVGGRCCVARVNENEKKACKHWFTGSAIVAKTIYVNLGCFQKVYSPEEAPGRVARVRMTSRKKVKKITKRGFPDPEDCCQRSFLSPR